MIVLRQDLPTFIERNVDQTLSLPTFELAGNIGGEPVQAIPSAIGTFQLFKRDGSITFDPPKANAIVNGLLSVDLTAADLDLDSDHLYVEVWTGTFDGVVETFRREAIVSKYVPRQTITDADLYRVLPDLRDCLPGNQSSWEPQRSEAWAQLNARLIAKGNRANLIVSTWALRNVHLYWTLFLVAELMISEGSGGRWPVHLEKFESRTKAEWDTLSFEYDADDDDDPDDRQSANPTVVLGNLPDVYGPASSEGSDWGR